MFDLRSVILQCVFDILELISVILRLSFNTVHRKLVISYDVFLRSCHFTRVFEGSVSKITCLFVDWATPRNRMESQPPERVLFHMEIRTLSC